MYAKLVTGTANVDVINCIRDIGRLICSPSPSTANIFGFSNTLSVIVDSTPAGWTYLGSNSVTYDLPVLSTNTINVPGTGMSVFSFQAPGLYNTKPKTLVLYNINTGYANTTVRNMMGVTGATQANSIGGFPLLGTPTGSNTVTGGFVQYNAAAPDYVFTRNIGIAAGLAGSIIHVIANQRHCTIIEEGKGFAVLWEMSMNDMNYWSNTVPFLTYSHCNTAVGYSDTNLAQGLQYGPNSMTSPFQNSIITSVYNVTSSTGVTYQCYDPTLTASQNSMQGLAQWNLGHLAQVGFTGNPVTRPDTLSPTGTVRYQVIPAFLEMPWIGWPTQFITGTTPIYWTRGSIGQTGDTTSINGVTYTWFNAGPGCGMLMTTGN